MNWLAFVPENVYELTATAVVLLLLVTVSTCGAVVTPGLVAVNAKLAGENESPELGGRLMVYAALATALCEEPAAVATACSVSEAPTVIGPE